MAQSNADEMVFKKAIPLEFSIDSDKPAFIVKEV
jgi:hypothetical protein